VNTVLRSAPPLVDRDVPGVAERADVPGADLEARAQAGRRLRLARVGQGMTQDEVAQGAGVTRNFVSAIERGTQRWAPGG
jgi:ribosome-binding protein aMBF1 (putative translation factor)